MARTRAIQPADEPAEDPVDKNQEDDDSEDERDDDEEDDVDLDSGVDAEDEPQARVPTAAERIRNQHIAMYQHVLGFSPGAATALWEDQGIQTLEHLQELTDTLVDETCRAIQKPGGNEKGHKIPIISRQRLKLLAYWARHLHGTSRKAEDIYIMTWDDIKYLADQKTLEDNAKDGKDPPVPEMTLESANAAACFNQMRQYLRKIRSKTSGIPLDYVILPTLKGPWDLPDAVDPDPPPFGEKGTPYVSIDHELVTQAPILSIALGTNALKQPIAKLESDGPFERSFIADSATVYDILHTVWGKSSWWTHCKPFEKTKNDRQAYRTLHLQLLGGPRVVATGDAIIHKIQALVYEGDWRHFTFDKYVQLHIDQHNLHLDLFEYGVAALPESMKILWFQQGIKDKSMEPIKASIVAQTSNPDSTTYTTFQAVQEAYTAFYRQQTGNDPPKARKVSSVRGGRQTNNDRRPLRGKGQTDPREPIFTKAELDACVIELRKYTKAEYKRLTPLQQMKLWILRHPGRTPGQGPTHQDRREKSDRSSTALTTSSSRKRSREDDTDDRGDETNPGKDKIPDWGRNRGNPAIQGRQKTVNDMDT
jgi:hypothetical protein